MTLFILFLRLIRVGDLTTGLLLYALGGGIAKYLGTPLDWRAYWLGQGWVLFLQLANSFLLGYFENPGLIIKQFEEYHQNHGEKKKSYPFISETILFAAYASFVGLAIFTTLLLYLGYLSVSVTVLMSVAFFCVILNSTPPSRLLQTGYGEIVLAFFFTLLIPGISFVLLYGSHHRMLTMVCLPLFSSHMVMQLAYELKNYSELIRTGKKNMMILLGWKNGLFIHNLCILLIYITLGIAAIFGLPLFIIIPGLLLLPLGFFQFWQARRISLGGKPNWKLVTFNSSVIFYFLSYYFAFGLWTN